jgi:hypothetical protein
LAGAYQTGKQGFAAALGAGVSEGTTPSPPAAAAGGGDVLPSVGRAGGRLEEVLFMEEQVKGMAEGEGCS